MTEPVDTSDEVQLLPLRQSMKRSDLVFESIRSAILSRQLAPGQLLIERQVAEQLGVSKTPVREAFIALARRGLLSGTPNRGVTVCQLQERDVKHVYEERLLLEPWAVERAVSAGPVLPDASAALIEAQEHAASGDRMQQAMANRRFHRALYSRCENNLVVDTLDRLQDLTTLAVTGVLWERWPNWDSEAQQHERILAAASEGDGARASSLLYEHIAASIERVDEHSETV